MRIYEMTATFGKLQHQVLTLKPGLNIIEAPNEWGKTTWCAFLTAMLYGLDTRAKSTKTALADKEHYQPWSGTPMSGRIDLRWQGRDITIERRTRGRIPLGEFRAFETASGLPVPELTPENCGEKLLGAEQSVFRRAGFIRLPDMPVTRSEELNRRLNSLVTTGDESDDGERLAASLKDLRNRCRYNRTGLLPQAEGERDRLWNALQEQKELQEQCSAQSQHIREAEQWIARLQNHLEHLKGTATREQEQRVEQARAARDQARQNLLRMEGICGELPAREEAEYRLQQLQEFSGHWNTLLSREQQLPQDPPYPQPPRPFAGMTPEEARDMVEWDSRSWHKLQRHLGFLWATGAMMAWASAIALFALGAGGYLPQVVAWILCGILGAAGLALLITGFVRSGIRKRDLVELTDKYGSDSPIQWRSGADYYRQCTEQYLVACRKNQTIRRELDRCRETMQQQYRNLCGDQALPEALRVWQEVVRCWQELENARQAADQAQIHLEDLQAMVKPAPEVPVGEDDLTYSEEQTRVMLEKVRQKTQHLKDTRSQYEGRIQALDPDGRLQQRYDQVYARIRKLEEFYRAVTIALENLEAASQELQRRFAPKISSRAQELLERMTGGRYARLTLGEDFSLGTGAAQEDTLHSILWRSEGTVDQVYLALRLAVSEALTPEAPLVLDDALVRFDGDRLKNVLQILEEEGERKQVILFTCQEREGKLCPQYLLKTE